MTSHRHPVRARQNLDSGQLKRDGRHQPPNDCTISRRGRARMTANSAQTARTDATLKARLDTQTRPRRIKLNLRYLTAKYQKRSEGGENRDNSKGDQPRTLYRRCRRLQIRLNSRAWRKTRHSPEKSYLHQTETALNLRTDSEQPHDHCTIRRRTYTNQVLIHR